MEAIDFKKLLREERKRAKVKKKKERNLPNATKSPPDEKKKEQQQSSLVNRSDRSNAEKVDLRYDWKYPDGFLCLRALKLKSICENPRSISYSSTALEKQTLGKENDISKARHEPNNSGSDMPIPTNNLVESPEAALLDWLQNLPDGDSGIGEWKVMSYGKRRVCMFGEGTDKPMLPSPLAEIARELVARNVFPPSSCPAPNHVLLNEYQPGQGIFPHTDGPRYEDRTATLSLGSDVVIEFTKRLTSSEIGPATSMISADDDGRNGTNNHDRPPRQDSSDQSSSGYPIQVLLESGSLLVFQGDAYKNYCHGICMDVWKDTTSDHCLNAPSGKIVPRGLRYSLTFRHKKNRNEMNSS